MRIHAEIETNPGPAARFVAELKLSHGYPWETPRFWQVSFGWWLLKNWKNWLWHYEWDPGTETVNIGGGPSSTWKLLIVRLFGFELTWEHHRRVG